MNLRHRRSTQRDWTLQDAAAAAAAARAEADKLRAEFEAKFKAATSNGPAAASPSLTQIPPAAAAREPSSNTAAAIAARALTGGLAPASRPHRRRSHPIRYEISRIDGRPCHGWR